MRFDWYAKIVLGLIAIFLGIIALRPLVGGNIEMMSGNAPLWVFNRTTGQIWMYFGPPGDMQSSYVGTLVAPGQPIK